MTRSQSLARALSDGLTGWMKYQSLIGLGDVFQEHMLYMPILMIARSHGWETRFEVSWTHSEGSTKNDPGRPQSVDVFFIDRESATETWIACEVKFKSTKAAIKKQNNNLDKDLEKLRDGGLRQRLADTFGRNTKTGEAMQKPVLHRWLLLSGRFVGGKNPWSRVISEAEGLTTLEECLHPNQGVAFGVEILQVAPIER